MAKLVRQRYILFKIIKEKDCFFGKQDFLNTIWQSIWRYFGIIKSSKVGLWLIKMDEQKKFGIIRCTNETKEEIISALTLIREINGRRVIFSPVKTSGTIKGIEKMNK
jgi:RNase P/RNase MRP subunit POP5